MVSDKRFRLLIVTPRYFPFVGGVENHVYQTARRLVQRNVDVTVLTTDPGRHWATSEQIENINIRRVPAYPANRDYYFAPGIYRAITQGNWDIMHVQSYHTLVPPLAMFAALRTHIPYVLTFHGGGHSSQLRNRARTTQRILLRPFLVRARKLVALAKFEIDLFSHELNILRDKFVLIPNGSDLPQVQHVPTPQKSDDVLIAAVGRLEKYKGHQRIISALPDVLKRNPNVRLWIAGTGPYEAELKNLINKLGLAERVVIRAIPAANRQMMADELSKASLFVLLSEYETHPIAALEALALGLPVLVSDTSGLSELAEKGWAKAIPLTSTDAQVAQAIIEQLEHPLIPTSLNLPTWDDCTNGLLKLYQSILKDT